jgi:hypothetical protein
MWVESMSIFQHLLLERDFFFVILAGGRPGCMYAPKGPGGNLLCRGFVLEPRLECNNDVCWKGTP